MTITSSDVLEFIKIGIIVVVGFIIIKTLFIIDGTEPEAIKCICNCSDGVIRL